MPEISVLMSVYNGERFLAEAVESILKQSFKDFEFIIIDDGSTDNSSKILRKYAKQDSRVVLIEQENMGLVGALNHGLSLAKTSLIARMDADDIALPNRFQTQIDYMNSHPNIGVLGSAIIPIDTEGKQSKPLFYPCHDSGLDHYTYHYGSPLAHPAVMMRCDLVIEQGCYREEFKHAEDYDLWLRLHKVTKIDNLSEPLLKYRQHDDKISIYHAEAQAKASVMARYIAKHDLGHCDFDKIMREASEEEQNSLQWQMIDVMAGSLLFSPNGDTLKKYAGKAPKELLSNNKAIAVRTYLKFMFTAIKVKNYGAAIKYFMKSLCISPHKTLALIIEKLFKRIK